MKKENKNSYKRSSGSIKSHSDLNLNQVIELLKIPKEKRTKYDIKTLQNYMIKNIKYFQTLNEEFNSSEKISRIIEVLSYEYFKKDEHIINYDEIGNKFFILLSGTVNVYKPFPKNISMTLYDYVNYLVNIRDVQKNLLKFERIQNYNSNVDKDKLLHINYNAKKLPYSSEKLPFVIEDERLIGTIEEGKSFGEMSLIKDEPRNADIVANENCILVSIDIIDYKKIIKDTEEQKINAQLKYFKTNYPFFKDWPDSRCLRLISALTKENFMKEEYIYKQNSLPTDIYLIKKGEFEVTCDINFSILDKFVSYVYNNSDNLFKEMDNPYFWKEDNLQKKINKSYERDDNPFKLLSSITRQNLLHKISFPEMDKKNNLTNNQKFDKDKMKEISKVEEIENDIKYQNNKNRRIKICKLESPQIFGFIEPFDLKKRFCNIRCKSKIGEIQKIPFIEFLQLMPKDKNIRFFIESHTISRKKEIIEQVKNGMLAKLTFNYPIPKMKPFEAYPSRNLDKLGNNKNNLLVTSRSAFFNQNTKESELKNYHKIKREKSETIYKTNKKEISIKTKSNIIYGFKKTLFTYSDNNTKEELQYLLGMLHYKRKKKEFKNIIKYNANNRVRTSNYVIQKSESNILPTKFSLIANSNPVVKNYIDYSNRGFINKISINSNLLFNPNNKKELKYLPDIDSKKRSLSFRNLKFQSLNKIKRKIKKTSFALIKKVKSEEKD